MSVAGLADFGGGVGDAADARLFLIISILRTIMSFFILIVGFLEHFLWPG